VVIASPEKMNAALSQPVVLFISLPLD